MGQGQDKLLVRDVEAGRADLDLAVALQVPPCSGDHVGHDPAREHLSHKESLANYKFNYSMH